MNELPNRTLKKNFSRLGPLLIFLLMAFLLYGNSIKNDYCLDDAIVITNNSFTNQGISGIGEIFAYESFTGFFGKEKQLVSGGRYRPLSIATFAIENQYFGLNPHVSHFINVVLYGLSGYLIFLILLMLWPQTDYQKWYSGIAFLASALFMAHPIHTEVVANIKGRDEILALLFSLLSFWQALLYIKKNNNWNLVYSALFFVPALFSKEHALVFLIIIPVAIALTNKNIRKEIPKVFFALLIPAIVFLVIRHAVLGQMVLTSSQELMNDSFLQATQSQHVASVFFVFLKYLHLLVFPHPLTYDYYPYHIPLNDWGSMVPVLSVLAYSVIVFSGLFFIKRLPLLTISILLFLLPLLPVSNIFFPIGTFLNERFLYIPSLGFCLFIGFLLWKGIHSRILKFSTYFLIAGLGIFFTWKTVSRNFIWKNDLTLFTTDVQVSANSAKGNCAAGGILFDTYKTNENRDLRNEKISMSIQYLKRATEIHPTYETAWLLLGNAYTLFPDSLNKALHCYKTVLTFNPGNTHAIQNIEYVAMLEKNILRRAELLEQVLMYEPKSYMLLCNLGNIWGKDLNNISKARVYLEKALEVNPNGMEALKDLGVTYAMTNDFKKSATIFQQVIKIDSLDANNWINLGLTYNNLKEPNKAKICFEKAKLLQTRK